MKVPAAARASRPGGSTRSHQGAGDSSGRRQLAAQGLQGLHAPQGLHGLQAAHGLQGLHAAHGLQGLHAAHGLHGLQAAQGLQGLQGLHGLHDATTIGFSPADAAEGASAAPAAMVTTVTATTVSLIMALLLIRSGSARGGARPGGIMVESGARWKEPMRPRREDVIGLDRSSPPPDTRA